jgi:Protein of unknown function (DUF3370)
MFPLLPFVTVAQVPSLFPPPTTPRQTLPREVVIPRDPLTIPETQQVQEVFQPQEIRPLPGELDTVPVLNSNSPEVVGTEGILISTFPPQGKSTPSAHLNFPFQGRFDIFAHHISKTRFGGTRSLFQGILLNNPTSQPVTVEVLQGASYLTRPDALFVALPSYVNDPLGTVYAGPGSRVMNDLLRGRRQGALPREFVIPPGQNYVLMNLPIPAGTSSPSSNGRTTLLRLRSSGSVYAAVLAMFAPVNGDRREQVPSLEDWQNLVVRGSLAGPRDVIPTPPTANVVKMYYGRVSGVALGSQWQAKLTDTPKGEQLTIPKRGRAFSYGISTLDRGTFGTGQIQSAKLVARYPDTAYRAHGNYGIQYSLTLPLVNPTKQPQSVTLALQTPLKEDKNKGGLLFYNPPENRVFFRGTVRLRYTDDGGSTQTRFIHVTQQRGQKGEPLLVLNMPAGDRRTVQVDFLYPPDSTPPQVLTVKTLDETSASR